MKLEKREVILECQGTGISFRINYFLSQFSMVELLIREYVLRYVLKARFSGRSSPEERESLISEFFLVCNHGELLERFFQEYEENFQRRMRKWIQTDLRSAAYDKNFANQFWLIYTLMFEDPECVNLVMIFDHIIGHVIRSRQRRDEYPSVDSPEWQGLDNVTKLYIELRSIAEREDYFGNPALKGKLSKYFDESAEREVEEKARRFAGELTDEEEQNRREAQERVRVAQEEREKNRRQKEKVREERVQAERERKEEEEKIRGAEERKRAEEEKSREDEAQAERERAKQRAREEIDGIEERRKTASTGRRRKRGKRRGGKGKEPPLGAATATATVLFDPVKQEQVRLREELARLAEEVLAKEAIQLWIDTANEFGDNVPEPKGCRLMYA